MSGISTGPNTPGWARMPAPLYRVVRHGGRAAGARGGRRDRDRARAVRRQRRRHRPHVRGRPARTRSWPAWSAGFRSTIPTGRPCGWPSCSASRCSAASARSSTTAPTRTYLAARRSRRHARPPRRRGRSVRRRRRAARAPARRPHDLGTASAPEDGARPPQQAPDRIGRPGAVVVADRRSGRRIRSSTARSPGCTRLWVSPETGRSTPSALSSIAHSTCSAPTASCTAATGRSRSSPAATPGSGSGISAAPLRTCRRRPAGHPRGHRPHVLPTRQHERQRMTEPFTLARLGDARRGDPRGPPRRAHPRCALRHARLRRGLLRLRRPGACGGCARHASRVRRRHPARRRPDRPPGQDRLHRPQLPRPRRGDRAGRSRRSRWSS